MASWFDIFAFIVTASIFVGAVYVVRLVSMSISDSVKATKESLKSKGVNISASGVSVRTSAHYSHEDYVDATQRGLIRAMGASGFSTADNIDDGTSASLRTPPTSASTSSAPPPTLSRAGSNASVLTNGSTIGPESEAKRRRHFGLKRSKE